MLGFCIIGRIVFGFVVILFVVVIAGDKFVNRYHGKILRSLEPRALGKLDAAAASSAYVAVKGVRSLIYTACSHV